MTTIVVLPDPELPQAAAVGVSLDHGGPPRALSVALDQLPRQQHLVAVWPAEQVALLALQLPALPPARLAAALAGALEDRLLGDPAELHLAAAPAAPGAPLQLAASCRRQPLQRWLQLAASHGLAVDAVVPEPALLEPGQALLQQRGDQLRLLWRDASGEAAWRLLPESAAWPLPGWTPQSLLHDAAGAASAQRWFGGRVNLQLITMEQWLVRAAQSGWNLRQFGLAPRAALQAGAQHLWQQARTPAWRRVGQLLLLLLAIQLLGLNARAWQLRQQQNRLQSQLQQLLTQSLPGAAPTLDPARQMQVAIDAVRRSRGLAASDSLDGLLGAAAGLLPAAPALSRIDYSGSRIRLELTPDQAAAARLRCPAAGLDCRGSGSSLDLGGGG